VIERERIEGVEGTCGIQNGNLTNAANSMWYKVFPFTHLKTGWFHRTFLMT
jgi:hypothetical protein